MENQVVQSVCVWCWMGGWTRRKLSFFPIMFGRSFVCVCAVAAFPVRFFPCPSRFGRVAIEFCSSHPYTIGKRRWCFRSICISVSVCTPPGVPFFPRVQLQQQATLPAYGFNLQSRMERIPFAQVFFVCGCGVEKIFLRISIFRFWNSIFCVLAPGAAGSSEIGNRC